MKFFTIDELCASETARRLGIDNEPDESVKANLQALVENVLDPLRERWGAPLTVTSGYRSPSLNVAVGGAARSQHLAGCAADISAGSRDANRRLFGLLKNSQLPYDQLIDECRCRWLHVSYSPAPRRMVLYL